VLFPDLEWSEELRSFLLEVEGELAWHQLERLGPAPESWFLFLGALVLHAPPGAELRLCERLQLAGDLRRRMMALPGAVEGVRTAAKDASLAPSQRLHRVEGQPSEVLLLAMAEVDLADGGRRRDRDGGPAAIAGQRQPAPGGRDPAGPHVGRAIRRARDAVVDRDIGPDGALEFAINAARQADGVKAVE
jgi:hypothetical protein